MGFPHRVCAEGTLGDACILLYPPKRVQHLSPPPYALSCPRDSVMTYSTAASISIGSEKGQAFPPEPRPPGRNSCFVSSCQPRATLPFQLETPALKGSGAKTGRGAKGPQPGPIGHRLKAGFWEGSGCPSHEPCGPESSIKGHIALHGLVAEPLREGPGGTDRTSSVSHISATPRITEPPDLQGQQD